MSDKVESIRFIHVVSAADAQVASVSTGQGFALSIEGNWVRVSRNGRTSLIPLQQVHDLRLAPPAVAVEVPPSEPEPALPAFKKVGKRA